MRIENKEQEVTPAWQSNEYKPRGTISENQDLLQSTTLLDERIKQSSGSELSMLIQAKVDLVRMAQLQLDQDHLRNIELATFAERQRERALRANTERTGSITRSVVTIGALGIGTLLSFHGESAAGMLLLGAATFTIVPEFVRFFFRGRKAQENVKL